MKERWVDWRVERQSSAELCAFPGRHTPARADCMKGVQPTEA